LAKTKREIVFDKKTRKDFSQTKFIFPQSFAAESWYSMNGSTLQNILSPISLEEIDKIVKINQEELLKSCQTIHQVIQEEIEIGIPHGIFFWLAILKEIQLL
ncbi:30496_t:CDS:1, partial [Racocetra persica]